MLPPLLIPLPFSFIKTFLFLSVFFLPTYCASNDVEGYKTCAPFSCGNFSDISYPFWNNNNQQDYCGHPKFKLDCKQDKVTIDIMSQKFLVIDISQTTQTLKIARLDLHSDPCPKEYTNVELDFDFFSFTWNDDNITLLYDCGTLPFTPPVNSGPSIPTFSCNINGAPVACFVISTNFDNFIDLGCKFSIKVPVLSEAVKSSIKDGFGVGYVLENGFEVGWRGVNEDQCDSCITSGGRCGHNASSNEFICFCYNNQQPYDGICGNNSSKLPLSAPPAPSQALLSPYLPIKPEQSLDSTSHQKWGKILGIGASCVGGLLAIVGIVAFYLYHRRKYTHDAISYIQPRSMSSDPSLKDTETGSIYYGVHLFTYSELEEATNYFDPSRELGDGGFGTVYFGKLQDGRSVAVKRLYENNYRRVEQFKNEIAILADLRHRNLVSLYGCTSRHSRELLLVYEYIPNGTVADHLHGERAKGGTLPWHIRMNIAVETASALTYLHASEIIHRDVKTNNILLDEHFVVKVADFGLSRLFPSNVTHISTVPQGTPGYVDPEYHECYQLTVKSDVYSFGVVLIELVSSLPAVDITRHRHEINLSNMAINKIHNQALHELVDPHLGFESDYKVRKMINAVAELAFQCLQSSKDMRPTMQEVLDTLKDIQSGGKYKSQPEVMDISSAAADDVVLLKDDPPPPSPDSNIASKSTTPNASG